MPPAGAEAAPDGVVQPAVSPGEKQTILIRATADEAPGATLKVAGLTVFERAIKQLRRSGHRVVVASDGSFPLPSRLPFTQDVRRVVTNDEVQALARDLNARVVAADVVRPSNRDLESGRRVTDEASRVQAEDAIFSELLRGDLGLVARHLNKPVSFRITRYLLCRLPVTPNQVTLGAAAIGLAGCAMIASGQAAWALFGFFLSHLQSILDGCDGELARVRYQQSPIGEWLDTVIDDALTFALAVSVGVGVSRLTGESWPLPLSLISAALLFFYNVVAYRELVRQREGGEVLKVRWWFTRGQDLKTALVGEKKKPWQLLMTLGRRDFFILAWFLLAVFELWTLIPVYLLFVAGPNGVVAAGQVLSWRRR